MPANSNRANSLLTALQLSSPALPIGGFAYSQGLEWAIEEGSVHDYSSAQSWITDMLHFSLGQQELVLCGPAIRPSPQTIFNNWQG